MQFVRFPSKEIKNKKKYISSVNDDYNSIDNSYNAEYSYPLLKTSFDDLFKEQKIVRTSYSNPKVKNKSKYYYDVNGNRVGYVVEDFDLNFQVNNINEFSKQSEYQTKVYDELPFHAKKKIRIVERKDELPPYFEVEEVDEYYNLAKPTFSQRKNKKKIPWL